MHNPLANVSSQDLILWQADPINPFIIGYLIVPFTVFAIVCVLGILLFLKQRQTKAAVTGARELLTLKEEDAEPFAPQMAQAEAYRRQIITLLNENKSLSRSSEMAALIPQVERWAKLVESLTSRLNRYQNDAILQHDLEKVPRTIERLTDQQQSEDDAELRLQIQKTLSHYQKQAQHLDALSQLMRRTELELDQTLAAIGTIYSQLQLIEAMEVHSGRVNRLTTDLRAEVERLDDLLSAMADTYQS